MKTFEERYTAWIDGELNGSTLTAFEQELARRATEGEAAADKVGASRLRALLQTHLQAPALTNPDFFNHQILERIEVETRTSSRRRETAARREPTIFAWGLARLVGLGAACLFAAAALYYGMMPAHVGSLPGSSVPSNPSNVAALSTPAPAMSEPAAEDHPANSDDHMQLALRSPTPSPIDTFPDIKTYVPDQPANPTTITPLHYTQPNVNVLWLNGLDYIPSVSDAGSSAVQEASPTGSATP